MKENIEIAATLTMKAVTWIHIDRSHTELETAKLTAPETNAGPMATNAAKQRKGTKNIPSILPDSCN